MALKDNCFMEPSLPLGAPAPGKDVRLKLQYGSSTVLLEADDRSSFGKRLLKRPSRAHASSSATHRLPFHASHVQDSLSACEAGNKVLLELVYNKDNEKSVSRHITGATSNSLQQHQHQPALMSQKRPYSDGLSAVLHDELLRQQKQAKITYLRMHQRAGAQHSASSGIRWDTQAVEQGCRSTTQQHQEQQPLPCQSPQQQKHAQEQMLQPDLPSLTVAVKMLLQLAAEQSGPVTADALRQQLLQQVKALTAKQPVSVAAAVQQALPGLRACVLTSHGAGQVLASNAPQSSTAPEPAVQSAGNAAAAIAVAVTDGDDDDDGSPVTSPVACGITAIETALIEAACEVQLSNICIGRGAQQAAEVDTGGSSSGSTGQALDLEELFQQELAAALAQR